MNIQQAINEAQKHNKCITRFDNFWNGFSKLKLGTMDENYFFIVCGACNKEIKGAWQPQLTDIVALDWEVCD